MKIKLAFLSALFVSGLTLSNSTGALAADFSVRLGQPKTPTNQNNFKLTFVALDTRTDRNITVKCFKKGPSDGGYSQFDSAKIMISGGNTDFCNVTPSLLSSTGTYSFYVTAEASSTIVTSSTVNVIYNTTGPSTPSSYSKEKINSCDYKIKFKTADDGKTVKVQLFRSDSQIVHVGSGSLVASLNIGPNTEGEFINSTPNCDKDYYYALRSVDNSDNASGIVGDSYTTTTTSTSNTSTETTDGSISGAIPIRVVNSNLLDQDTDNLTTDSAEGAGEVFDISNESTPEVLGSSAESNNNRNRWFIGLIALVTGVAFVYSSRKKK